MIRLFRKKSEKERLYDLYNKLLNDSHRVSRLNRRLSDQLYSDAQGVLSKINDLERHSLAD